MFSIIDPIVYIQWCAYDYDKVPGNRADTIYQPFLDKVFDANRSYEDALLDVLATLQ